MRMIHWAMSGTYSQISTVADGFVQPLGGPRKSGRCIIAPS
jgi:hypothetical protein